MDRYAQLAQQLADTARAADAVSNAKHALIFLEHGLDQITGAKASSTVRDFDQALGRVRRVAAQQVASGTLDEATATGDLVALASRWSTPQKAMKERYKVTEKVTKAPSTLKQLIDQALGPDRR